MTAKYWIKLYHEVLHDRKIATLDDRLWRRFIEVLLLAGENNDDGLLPSLDDMAWSLRCDAEQLETELTELVRINVLEIKGGYYFVRKFADRQGPMPKREYMRRKRDDEQKQEHYDTCYQPVTIGNIESDTDTDTDKNHIGEEAYSPDDFDQMQDLLQTMTGLPAMNYNDAEAIRECLKMGVISDDIAGALQWRKDNGRGPVKTIAQLLPGIKTNYSQRVQGDNARPQKRKSKVDRNLEVLANWSAKHGDT